MGTFTILVDRKNLENRVEGLQRILGFSHGGSTSKEQIAKDFRDGRAMFDPRSPSGQATELHISQSTKADFASSKSVVADLRSQFPEMRFKSELLDRILEKSQYYDSIICRGFVSSYRGNVSPQQVEFELANSQDEIETVITQDTVDSSRGQTLFIRRWSPVGDFVTNLVEPWLASERIEIQEIGEIALPFFQNPSFHALSEYSQKWLPLPCLVYSQAWPNVSQQGLEKRYLVVRPTGTYADIHHAYSVLFHRTAEQVQFNSCFYVPEHRGKLSRLSVEANGTKFDVVVGVQNPRSLSLRLKLSYALTRETKVVECDAPGGEISFEIDSFPKEVKAELVAPDLVDRLTLSPREVGSVTTSVQTTPPYKIETELGLPVRSEIVVGAKRMVSAYAQFFVLENSLRLVVKDSLVKSFANNWVQTIQPVLLAGKSKHEQKRLGRIIQSTPDRILEHVYYRDLGVIIEKFWNEFQAVFLDKNKTLMKLTELEDLRNDIAHNRVLSDHDVKRIEVYYMDLLSKI
jgi:hypothetical protein